MNGFILVLIGLWIIGVGWNANGINSLKFFGEQKGFVSWLVAVIVLYTLSRVPKVRPVVIPIIWLAVLAIIIKRWSQIQTELQKLEGKK